MRRLLLPVLLCCLQVPVAAQEVTLSTLWDTLPANADRVLLQPAGGDWQVMAGDRGSYRMQVTTPHYSLVVVCFGADGPVATLYRFLTAELPHLTHACSGASGLLDPQRRLSATIMLPASPPAPAQAVDVYYGPWQVFGGVAPAGGALAVSVPERPTADLLALRSIWGGAPDQAVLLRAIGSDRLQGLSIDLRPGYSLQLERYALSAQSERDLLLSARLVTCNGVTAEMQAARQPGSAGVDYAALPEAARQACDRYQRGAADFTPEGVGVRLAAAFDAEPNDTVLSLPPLPPPLQLSSLSLDPLRLTLGWRPSADATLYFGGVSTGGVWWNFYQSASLSPNITLPAPGAQAGVPEPVGGTVQWYLGVVGSNMRDPAAALVGLEHAPFMSQGRYGRALDGLRLSVAIIQGEWTPTAP